MPLFIILGGFGSSLGNTDGFAIAFLFCGERGLGGNGGNAIFDTINSDGTAVQIPDPEDPWAIFIQRSNDESSYIDWSGAGDYEDATPHRIVYNIPSVSDASTWEIFADQSQQSVSVGANRSPSNFKDFEHPLLLFARYSSGTPSEFVDVVLDDVWLFGKSLTEHEVLSYQNLWV